MSSTGPPLTTARHAQHVWLHYSFEQSVWLRKEAAECYIARDALQECTQCSEMTVELLTYCNYGSCIAFYGQSRPD